MAERPLRHRRRPGGGQRRADRRAGAGPRAGGRPGARPPPPTWSAGTPDVRAHAAGGPLGRPGRRGGRRGRPGRAAHPRRGLARRRPGRPGGRDLGLPQPLRGQRHQAVRRRRHQADARRPRRPSRRSSTGGRRSGPPARRGGRRHPADAAGGRATSTTWPARSTAGGSTGCRSCSTAPTARPRGGPRVFDRAGGGGAWRSPAGPTGSTSTTAAARPQPGALAGAVVATGADLGLALDGDADRMVAVDHTGAVADGDTLLALFAVDLADRGELTGDAVVVTVMTNLGFRLAMDERGHRRARDPGGRPPRAGRARGRGVRPGRRAVGHIVFRAPGHHRRRHPDRVGPGRPGGAGGPPAGRAVGRPGRAGAPGAGERGRGRPRAARGGRGGLGGGGRGRGASSATRPGGAAPERHRAGGAGDGGGGHSGPRPRARRRPGGCARRWSEALGAVEPGWVGSLAPCAASSASTGAADGALGRSSRACTASSTAATTRPAWPWWPRGTSGGPGRPRAPTRWTSWPALPGGARRPAPADRPHPLGHPRQPHGRERPPPPRLHRPGGRGPQRDHREPHRAGRGAGGRRATGWPRRPTPRSWPTSSRRSWPAGRPLAEALRAVVARLRGSFSVAAVSADEPEAIVAARRAAPLVVGVDDGVGAARLGHPGPARSDPAAVRPRRRPGGRARPGDPAGHHLRRERGGARPALPSTGTSRPPRRAATTTSCPRRSTSSPRRWPTPCSTGASPTAASASTSSASTTAELAAVDKVFIVACGSSYHAAMVAKYAIEHWARLPTEVDIASEFRYRDPVLDRRTLTIGVSQSGETLDTLQALREARRWGAKVLVVTNVVDSSMAREADGVLYTRAGPEVGVASTKCHLAQIVALELLALDLAQLRGTLDAGRGPGPAGRAARASRARWPRRCARPRTSTRWPTRWPAPRLLLPRAPGRATRWPWRGRSS